MTDRTPVASISDQSLDNYWYGPSAENVNTDTNITHSLSAPNMDATPAKTPRNWRMWLRLLNGVFHVALCVALLAFLGYALLYILLCIQGLWNLLHIPVSRYHPTSPFKKNNKKNTTTKTSPISRNTTTAAAAAADTINNTNNNNRSTTTFNLRLSVAGTEHSSISLTWRNWIRTRSSRSRDDLAEAEAGFFHRPPSADRTLRGDERQQPRREREGERGRRGRRAAGFEGDEQS
ncbi:hypothetical protein NEMBOFW57_007129 [Staphylotrichum longicolle]|uniref:Uncharacterized protein n=1 Tax=Staphylotrichum longicolle TaxID=669026 RepID=A0AAD4EUG9_9PEZI|nr:hypothetical protein NEMBOFW57_007129 [Staphylotrichum longicolle]